MLKETKMKITKKLGIYTMILGVVLFFLNIVTYGYWGIDIDIPAVFIFIVGLIIFLIKKNNKPDKKKKSNK